MEERVGPDGNAFANDKQRINFVLNLRKKLLRTRPITSKQITKLDRWLIAQPHLSIQTVVQIWTRMMWVSAWEYEREKDPLIKHLNLLSLRDHYHNCLQLPEWAQENLRPYWAEWLGVLNEEERKLERRNGYAQ